MTALTSRVGPASTRRLAAVWWIPLLMIVATEYKFRRRDNDDALAGSIDLAIIGELAVYLLIGAYLLTRLRPRVRRHVLVIWAIGYCVTTALSALYAPFPLLALARAVQFVIILVAVIDWTEIADLDMVERFLHAYVVLISVSIAIGIAWVAPTTVRQVGRFTWLYTHSVMSSLMTAVSCTILFAFWIGRRSVRLPWARWVYGMLLAFNVVALLRGQTRGSIGATCAAFVVMAVLWLNNRGRRDLVTGLLIAVVSASLAFGGFILTYLERGEDVAKIGTFNRRTEIWSLAWETFLTRPLHGLGFTAARGVFFDDTGLGGAHNAFVNVVIDTGLLGLIWWLGLIALIVVGAWRIRAKAGADVRVQLHTTAILGVMTVQLVNGFTTESFGAGVTFGGIFLLVTAGWVVTLDDHVEGGRRAWRVARRVPVAAQNGDGASPRR